MRAKVRLVSDVVSSQTPLATGEVDIVIAGDEWLTAVLTGDQPERTLTIPKQGGMRWTQPIEVLKASEGKIWLSSS